ncbi:EAL domain-containing protein [Franconibacter pulveris 1160]|uniref:EAL domain-containing protein n=1 Tax=Franconibacter pulveris TaxID=435910 RepID=UPI0004642178|nr:EAL domain-containing protein [Franconibacter pulveris]
MKTKHRVSLITGMLTLALLLPVLFSIWFAHHQAEKRFRSELNSYTDRTIRRTGQVEEQAKLALWEINRFQGETCSPAHLQAMRRLTFSFRHVQEVMYMRNRTLLCSSLESRGEQMRWPRPDRINAEGYAVWFTQSNDLNFYHYMVALGIGSHVVVMDPMSFIDVIPFGSWPIEVALIGLNQNRVIASSVRFDESVWQRAQQGKLSRLEYQGNVYLIRRQPESGFALVVWASRLPLEKESRDQMMVWLPLGVAISAFAVVLMLRLLRRIQSPRYRLLDAINASELRVYYQPVVNLSNGRVVGAEALVRWPQPDGSMLTPDIFIPLAEQTGLISRITRQVVQSVFRDLGDYLHVHPDMHISINLALEDLFSDDLLDLLTPLLARWQVEPQQIALEITERGFADPKVTSPVIERLREAGHKVYIDDFGTGYSSLSYLQDLPVDILKIDKSFVDALEYKQVTPHIIEMAKSLRLEMVAEGVETESQADWLRLHGVQYGQGWLYSKALPPGEYIAWFNQQNATLLT